MHFPTTALLFGLVATCIAGPTRFPGVKARQAVTPQAYADFQVSDGVAGNALGEVNAEFPVRILPCKLATLSIDSVPDHRSCLSVARRSTDSRG